MFHAQCVWMKLEEHGHIPPPGDKGKFHYPQKGLMDFGKDLVQYRRLVTLSGLLWEKWKLLQSQSAEQVLNSQSHKHSLTLLRSRWRRQFAVLFKEPWSLFLISFLGDVTWKGVKHHFQNASLEMRPKEQRHHIRMLISEFKHKIISLLSLQIYSNCTFHINWTAMMLIE